MEELDQDVYVTQLKAVFDTCDSHGTGQLSKPQLLQLCSKLNVDDQANELIKRLVGTDPKATVNFEKFKSGFIQVLSESVDGLNSEEDEETDEISEEDMEDGHQEDVDLESQDLVSPKYVNGEKKYGRRSKPEFESECSQDSGHGSSNQTGTKKLEVDYKQSGNQSTGKESNHEEKEMDMYEADGELNRSGASTMSMPETVGAEVDLVSGEEEHLRDIWRELGVGKEGYLTQRELALVCQHIGMEDMNEEELEQLFDKLDEDSDGRVSFDEFLGGLFQHGSNGHTPGTSQQATPTPPALRLPSSPRGKVHLSVGDTRGAAPTGNVSPGPSMFSALDREGTGFAHTDEIVEYWEKLGVPDSVQVLEVLQFDHQSSVNLSELSGCLEHVLHNSEVDEEDAPCYHAAVTSCLHELNYLRSTVEHMAGERNKLKADLADANARNAMLVKESDDRHASLERSCSKEISSMENQYLDQLKQLQENSVQEKHLIAQQSIQQTQELEIEIDRLKTEEVQLKEKLSQTQKDLELLEAEILELTQRCAQMQIQNGKQQQELDQAADIQAKLEEMEAHQSLLHDERERYTQQKVCKLEKEIIELKDLNDELVMEVTDLQQQVQNNKRRSRGKRGRSREGSVLADYTEDETLTPVDSEDDDSTSSKKRKRVLTETDSPDKKVEELEQEVFELRETKSQLEDAHSKELRRLQRGQSRERKDIEQAFKLEITDIEQKHMDEKDSILQQFEREKIKLREDMENDFVTRLEADRKLSEDTFEREKKEVISRLESERDALKKELAEAQKKLKEGNKKVTAKPQTGPAVTATAQDVENLQQRNADLQLQMKLQREELELQFRKQLSAQQQKFDEELAAVKQKHRMEIYDSQDILVKGADGLNGKLKEDFYTLLEQSKIEILEKEREKIRKMLLIETEETMLKEREETIEYFKKQKEKDLKTQHDQLSELFEEERDRLLENQQADLHTQFQQQRQQLINDHEIEMDQLRDQLRNEKKELQEAHRREIDHLQCQLQDDTYPGLEDIDEDVAAEERATLEDELTEQIEKLKSAFTEEREELMSKVSMLEGEINELRECTKSGERLREHMAEVNRTLEAKHKKEIEEINKKHEKELDQSNEKHGQELDEMNSTNTALRLGKVKLERELDKLVERNVGAAQVEPHRVPLLTSYSPNQSFDQSDDRDKVLLEAIYGQRALLEDKSAELLRSIKGLNHGSPQYIALKLAYEKLAEESQMLEETLVKLQRRMQTMSDRSKEADMYKVQMEEWKKQCDTLKNQLDNVTALLAEKDTSLSLNKAEQQRQIRKLKEENTRMVDPAKYNDLNLSLGEAERKNKNLESMLSKTSADTSKFLAGLEHTHQRKVSELDEEREDLTRQLGKSQSLLQDQVNKLKEQLEKNTQSDVLVKELYIENATLMEAVHRAEQKEKEAKSRVGRLEDKCKTLYSVLVKICPAAMA